MPARALLANPWPARVKPAVSDALVSQVDLLRSLAELTGAKLAADAGPDSENMLPALLGDSKRGRQLLVEQSNGLALRDGAWKFIPPGKGPKVLAGNNTETGIDPEPQLYDLSADIGEKKNLAMQHPDRVKQMADKLQKVRSRSQAGTPTRAGLFSGSNG